MIFFKIFVAVLLSFASSEDPDPNHKPDESRRIVCPKLECPSLTVSNETLIDSNVNPSDVCFSHDGSSPTSII